MRRRRLTAAAAAGADRGGGGHAAHRVLPAPRPLRDHLQPAGGRRLRAAELPRPLRAGVRHPGGREPGQGLPPRRAPERARPVPPGRGPPGWERPCPPSPAGSGSPGVGAAVSPTPRGVAVPRSAPAIRSLGLFGVAGPSRSLPSPTFRVWGETPRFSLKILSGEGSESPVTCGPSGKGSVRAHRVAEREKIMWVCFGLFYVEVSEEFDA